MKAEFRYRYVETMRSSGLDESGLIAGSPDVRIDVEAYPVLRRTPKGVWIRYALQEKFILDTAKKKFAHSTPELALESFIARKTRQIKLLESQMSKARRALQLAEDLWNER